MEASRNRRHLVGIVFALLTAASAACPAVASSAVPASGKNGAINAVAVVSFRIVVAEVVAFDPGAQRQPANAPTLTRTETIESGKRLITIARP